MKIVARLKVLLTAAPTILASAGTVVSVVWAEVVAEKVLPSGWETPAGRIVGVALAVIATATGIVRRVTPVAKEARGVLPPAPTEGA
jgi:hypothetical protein